MNLFELDGFAGLMFPSFSPIPCHPALNWQVILQPQGHSLGFRLYAKKTLQITVSRVAYEIGLGNISLALHGAVWHDTVTRMTTVMSLVACVCCQEMNSGLSNRIHNSHANLNVCSNIWQVLVWFLSWETLLIWLLMSPAFIFFLSVAVTKDPNKSS